MASDPQVTISQGALWGKYMTTRGGKQICAFQGIPYAKPPVGELRFKPPQDPDIWIGPRQAKTEGPICAQLDFISNISDGSEDCLYLNVYAPKVKPGDGGYSVMVWIHGGGFAAGSGNTDLYGPEYLLDEDIVLVTINYRVGVLGFLNLGVPEAGGNLGLKDQVAALRWVQKNIGKFGGNSNSVTIFGESAGGASVNYLLISPLSRGLFHRAIAQSGSAFGNWAFQPNAVETGHDFASLLGCKQATISSQIASLREASIQQLIDTEMALRKKTGAAFGSFAPSLEAPGTPGAFLTQHPRDILAKGDVHNVPVIIGCTSHEGMLTYAMLQIAGGNIQSQLKNNQKRYVPNEFKNSPYFNEIWKKIINFYEKLETNDEIERFIHLCTDLDFNAGIDELVRGIAALRRNPVYYYKFTYDGGIALLKSLFSLDRKDLGEVVFTMLIIKVKSTAADIALLIIRVIAGTCHADELGYLFTRTIISDDLKSAPRHDLVTIDRMTKMWTNFAKFGKPTPDGSLGVCWEPVKAPLYGPKLADTHYLEIGAELTMKKEKLNEERNKFWHELNDMYRPQSSKL